MAEVNWIKGELNPPSSGEYYVIEEAQHDLKAVGIAKGDIEITTDYYDAKHEEWDELGKDNPTWKVLAWADVLRPDIPGDLKGRVKRYFGKVVCGGSSER
jgi:hypothetical protein